MILSNSKTYANGNAKFKTFFFKYIAFTKQPKISSYKTYANGNAKFKRFFSNIWL